MGNSKLEIAISNSHYASGTEYERTSKQYMRAMVPKSPTLRILNVGCGTGINASFFSESKHHVVGIDISPVAVEQYRARGFEGYVCDIESQPLPFDAGSFDLVYASEVMSQVLDARGGLAFPKFWADERETPDGLAYARS
jgi:SAM-dependent methyltransferase